MTTEYSWNGVIQFLQEKQRFITEKETEWLIEKEEILNKSSQLEGELKAQQTINIDLLRRIKMLEYCLRAERYKLTQN